MSRGRSRTERLTQVSKPPRLEGKENVMTERDLEIRARHGGRCSPRVRPAPPHRNGTGLRGPHRVRHARASTYFSQRLQPGLHDELVLAELAAARVGALDPLLQAGLVHEVQAPGAVAGRDQRALVVPLAVADPGRQESQALPAGLTTGCQVHTPKRTSDTNITGSTTSTDTDRQKRGPCCN